MNVLVRKLRALRKGILKKRIDERLKEFKSFERKGEKEWFSELCFCLLTANAKAKTAYAVQSELGFKGFYGMPADKLCKTLVRNKHRFHNTKTKRIVEGRKHFGIKATIQTIIKEEGIVAARDWLQENVKGFGFKEASHFLRNVGYDDIAILDRHVINLLLEHGLLENRPTSLNRPRYLAIERVVRRLAHEARMSMAELDMYLWYMEAKDVLK